MAEEKFVIISKQNPSIVKDAEGEQWKGGEDYRGVVNGQFQKKPNAKNIKRVDIPTYEPSDNLPLEDTNPFDPKIKEKNNKVRETIIPLLNPMSKTDGIRLNSIEQEVNQDIAIEKAKPEPDPNILDNYNKQKDLIDTQKKVGDKGRDGIAFPPREEGVNSAKIKLT
jgi:hypothetical protein